MIEKSTRQLKPLTDIHRTQQCSMCHGGYYQSPEAIAKVMAGPVRMWCCYNREPYLCNLQVIGGKK